MRPDADALGLIFSGASITSDSWIPSDGILVRHAESPQSIWVVTMTLLPGASRDCGSLRQLLSDEEWEKTHRFRREEDRWSYAASHGLCRVMLATTIEVPPTAIEYCTSATGRPEVKAPRLTRSWPLCFSLSHTVRGVACAVSQSGDVGADIEWMDPRLTVSAFDELLSPTELADGRAGEAADVRTRLLGIWTLKEAYLKAAGIGLTVHPHSFTMGISPPRVVLPPATLRDSRGWALASWSPSSEHVAALAVRHD
jgi:4'-phosphopantetheinyl transferase